jgi:hypothetical protein
LVLGQRLLLALWLRPEWRRRVRPRGLRCWFGEEQRRQWIQLVAPDGATEMVRSWQVNVLFAMLTVVVAVDATVGGDAEAAAASAVG